MLYALDTNATIDLQTGHPQVAARCLTCPPDSLATTVITVEEQLSGWYTLLRRAKDPARLAHAYRRLADTVEFLGHIKILSYTEPAIERYKELAKLKLGVKHMDLRIAAIALEFGGTLVTSNTVDFKDVPGLTIEDWRVDSN